VLSAGKEFGCDLEKGGVEDETWIQFCQINGIFKHVAEFDKTSFAFIQNVVRGVPFEVSSEVTA